MPGSLASRPYYGRRALDVALPRWVCLSTAAEASRNLARARVETDRARGRDARSRRGRCSRSSGWSSSSCPLPLVMVLPRSVPALLFGLRMLASSSLAARAFTWVTWRWTSCSGGSTNSPQACARRSSSCCSAWRSSSLWLLVKGLG